MHSAMEHPENQQTSEYEGNWLLLQTKPSQEQRALLNLERQGYRCYLPMLNRQRIRRGLLTVAPEPLFPRYLFIQMDINDTAINRSSIRSTKGVSCLVTFGGNPARVDNELIEMLRSRESDQPETVQQLFRAGDRLRITDGPFSGIECIYQMDNSAGRVTVLINLLSKQVSLHLKPDTLQPIN